MKAAKKAATAPKLGECCPVMRLALSRPGGGGRNRTGFEIAPFFNLKAGTGEALVYVFPKAKRADSGEFGFGTKFGSVGYATVAHCPFCGAKLEKIPA